MFVRLTWRLVLNIMFFEVTIIGSIWVATFMLKQSKYHTGQPDIDLAAAKKFFRCKSMLTH